MSPQPTPRGEGTIAAAYALNDRLIVAEGQGGKGEGEKGRGREGERGSGQSPTSNLQSLVAVDRPNVVVETVKRAEDGHGLIVRFYESQRRRGPVTLTAGFDLAEVWQTDLLERNQAARKPDGNKVTLTVRPYQIVTLRLVPS